MPTPGLSLVEFLQPPQALNYLRNACVPSDPSDAALLAEWAAAQGKLGAPFSQAGRPDIQPIPAADQAYIQELQQEAWVQERLAPYPQWGKTLLLPFPENYDPPNGEPTLLYGLVDTRDHHHTRLVRFGQVYRE